jgi:hypothetical protein
MKKDLRFKLVWLAGIIDGEGCLTISRLKKQDFYSTALSIHNTNLNLIKEVMFVLNSIKIPFTSSETPPQKLSKLLQYSIYIRNREDLLKFLNLIIPYLIGKKDQAEILKQFIESRLEVKRIINKRDKKGRIISSSDERGFNEKEIYLYHQIKQLKK